jgi:hypothetical protein
VTRKLLFGLAVSLLCTPTVPAQEMTLSFTAEGTLGGLDLVPVISPREVHLRDLGLTLDRHELQEEGTEEGLMKRTWIGRVQGIRDSRAVFTSVGGLTAGTVTLPGLGLMILPDGRVLTGDSQVVCGTLDDSPGLADAPLLDLPSKAASPVQITLALPFSTRASQAAGGDAAMRTILYNQGDVFQRVLDESGLSQIRLRIVGVRRLGIYDENVPSKSEFQVLNDRVLGAYRKQMKADLVIMTVTSLSNPRLGGVAHQFRGTPEAAYGLAVLVGLPGGVLIHEGGHLLSATHEAAFFSCAPDSSRIGIATIMRVDPVPLECYVIKVFRFSNPQTPYNWYGTPYQTGDRRHCNACRMSAAAPIASGFRQ